MPYLPDSELLPQTSPGVRELNPHRSVEGLLQIALSRPPRRDHSHNTDHLSAGALTIQP